MIPVTLSKLEDLDLSEEQQMVRGLVRKIVETEIRPKAIELDQTESFPWSQIQALAASELNGILVPERYSGQGGGHLLYLTVVEEIARACAATALVFFTNTHAQLPIVIAGTEYQKEKYLPPMVSGKWIGALAVTEPENGSDVAHLRTKATAASGGYVISGEKVFITSGDKADILIVLARTGRDGAKGISAFIVERNSAIRVSRVERKMGVRGSSTAALVLDDVFVPTENLLGKENEGFPTLMKTFDTTRLSTAAQALGIAEGAYDLALDYSFHRQQFGRTIYSFQAVQFRLAGMLADIAAGRALLYQIARLVDTGATFTLEASMAKLWCSEMAGRVTTEAVQILGGYGYLSEYGVERMMRDAKITQIYDGTNDIQKLVIARKVQETVSGLERGND